MNVQSQPIRLSQHLSVQQVGEEVLIYDERNHRAFCLNPVAAAVWNHCDGTHSIPRIADLAAHTLSRPITTELVHLTLDQLQQDGLLALDSPIPLLNPLSRRDMITRMGSGAALLLPAVAAITAPRAAQAYNGCTDCTPSQTRRRKKSSSIDFSDLD